MERTEYKMTNEELKELLEALKPTPVIKVGTFCSLIASSPQEKANRKWRRLGKKLGFDYMTAKPINGKGQRFFSAIPQTED